MTRWWIVPAVCVLAMSAWSQTPEQPKAQPHSAAANSTAPDAEPWEYSLTVDGYIIEGQDGYVSPTFTANSFYGASGVNPSSAFDGTGILYEDLWKATPNNSYTYQGYFTMDANQGALFFTPVAAVPEPGSVPLLAVGAFAWFALFRKLNRKNA